MLKILRNCLTIVLVAAAVALHGAAPAQAIAHGANARDGAYPFAVRLTMTGLPTADHGTRDSSCSGALIAPRWVITAGHCFRDAAGRRVSRPVARTTTATIGRVKIKGPGGYDVKVVAVRQADGTDVALAELADEVTGITPLRLSSSPPRPGEVLRLAGYGLIAGPDGYTPATRLQTGQFTLDEVGDTLLGTSGRAPGPDTSPCPHDSGGPYFRETNGRPTLVSVVSSGPGCPHTGPDYSARTDTLTDWIAATTNSHPTPYRAYAIALALALAALLAIALWWRLHTRRPPNPRDTVTRPLTRVGPGPGTIGSW